MALLDSVAARHGRALFEDSIMAASLDHAMWFHRPFRADEWMLYSQDSPNANGGGGPAPGPVFTPDGPPIATAGPEGRRGGGMGLGLTISRELVQLIVMVARRLPPGSAWRARGPA
mgnify:CR=1 FL=1